MTLSLRVLKCLFVIAIDEIHLTRTRSWKNLIRETKRLVEMLFSFYFNSYSHGGSLINNEKRSIKFYDWIKLGEWKYFWNFARITEILEGSQLHLWSPSTITTYQGRSQRGGLGDQRVGFWAKKTYKSHPYPRKVFGFKILD